MKQYSAIIILLLILFLGACLRFYRIRDLQTFRGDQAVELFGAYNILQGKFTLIGIKTSVSEMRNGAVMYYLISPFLYLLNYDPTAGGITQSLLQLASIFIVYYLGKKAVNEKAGLLACFLIATSPLLVRYSRQTMLAFYPLFFSGLSLLISYLLVQHFTKLRCFLLGVLVGFTLQIHYSAIILLGTSLILPWIFLPKKLFKHYYFFLLLGFIVGFFPMLLFELRHEFFNSKMFLLFLFQQKRRILLGKFNFLFYWQDTAANLFFGQNLFLGGLFILFLLTAFFSFRKKLNLVEKVCSLQIAASLAFSILFVREAIYHYMIVAVLPVSILTSSLLLRIRILFTKKWLSFIIYIIFFCLFIFNFPLYGFSDNHGWSMAPGWDLAGVEKAAKIIRSDVQQANWRTVYNVAMLIDDERRAIPLRYFLDIWGTSPLPYDKYDSAQKLYIALEPGLNLAKMDLWELTSFGPYTVEKTWSIQNGFTLLRLEKK